MRPQLLPLGTRSAGRGWGRSLKNRSECDLIVNHVRTGLHVSVFSEPYFEDLGRAEAERVIGGGGGGKSQVTRYMVAVLGFPPLSYKLIWRKLKN